MKRILIWLFILLITSCSPSFSKPKYKKRFQTSHQWKRREILIFNTGTFRDPTVKKSTRQKMIQPKTINLNKW